MARCLVIAGTASGVGKSSLTVALVHAFRRRGLRVRTAKVGPDYLDPMHLAHASGASCINLDVRMQGEGYVRESALRHSAEADVLLVEGVMGLFDGARDAAATGSTAQVARLLGAPVVLVADARGRAQSFAAEVLGYVRYDEALSVAGVIANRVGSLRHRELLADSLRSRAELPPLLGALRQGDLPELPSRHLGLRPPSSGAPPDPALERLESVVDVDALLVVARQLHLETAPPLPLPPLARVPRPLRLGVARDNAFCFVYGGFRELVESVGVEWVEFSPLADAELPSGLAGVFLPGGYPEEHAEALAANRSMIDSLRAFATKGWIYGECGGLLYLAESLRGVDGRSYDMVGLVPGHGVLGGRPARLGYVEVTLQADCLWGAAGQRCWGHEFHYSELSSTAAERRGVLPYRVSYSDGTQREVGFLKGRVLASYVHLHLASNPAAMARFLENLAL